MPNWPLSLPPIVLMEGYQESPPDLVIRSKPDVGPALVRRRATADVRPIAAMLKIRQNQIQYLDNFYTGDCQSGALQFTWQTQRSPDDIALIADTDILTDTEFLLVPANYRFVKPPVYTPLGGGIYRAVMQLEMMP